MAPRPGLVVTLVVIAASGVCCCYQLAANAAFVAATPPARRGEAFGIAQGGINLGQGAIIVVAGAATRYLAPADVIAAGGAAGLACALLIWAKARP
jgi:hypothetical protein